MVQRNSPVTTSLRAGMAPENKHYFPPAIFFQRLQCMRNLLGHSSKTQLQEQQRPWMGIFLGAAITASVSFNMSHITHCRGYVSLLPEVRQASLPAIAAKGLNRAFAAAWRLSQQLSEDSMWWQDVDWADCCWKALVEYARKQRLC